MAMSQKPGVSPFPSHINITTYTDWPYSRIKTYENGTMVGEGIAFELLQLLVKKFKFTYTIIPPAKDTIGDGDSGMIKQLYNKEVDMAVAFIPILSEFRQFCDFSAALDEMDTTFLMKRPGTSATGSGLFAPFSEKVWIMILISLMVVGPTIYFMILIRSKFYEDKRAGKFTFLTCIWFAYGALLKQGTTAAPIGGPFLSSTVYFIFFSLVFIDSVRLVFATWWIFITILTSFYTANLTAFLTLSKFTLPINSLEELVSERYSWFAIDGRSVQTLMQNKYRETEVLTRSKTWGYGYLSTDYNMSYTTMLKYAKNERVFIGDRILASLVIFDNYRNKTLEGLVQEKRCEYVITESNVLAKSRGFGFPKGSLLLKYLDQEMITTVERGIVQHFKTEKLPEATICPLNLKSKERRLKVSDLWITYKVVFCGMGVACVIFILELFLRLLRYCANSEYVRKCCRAELEGTSSEPWDYPQKEDSSFWVRTPPPVYQFNNEVTQKTYSINGRDYYIVKGDSGEQRLIPIRTPSAYLFQYIH